MVRALWEVGAVALGVVRSFSQNVSSLGLPLQFIPEHPMVLTKDIGSIYPKMIRSVLKIDFDNIWFFYR
jgi:hypothetical protein